MSRFASRMMTTRVSIECDSKRDGNDSGARRMVLSVEVGSAADLKSYLSTLGPSPIGPKNTLENVIFFSCIGDFRVLIF